MRKPIVIGVAVVVLLAAIGGWLFLRGKGHDGALKLYGNVDIRQVSLAFDNPGRVAEMRVQEGDPVKPGDVLAVMDTRTAQIQADRARATIETQSQALARQVNGARPEEIAQGEARVAAAQAQAVQAAKELSRLKDVAASTDGRGVSQSALDKAQADLDAARAKADEQVQALRLLRRGAREEDIASARSQVAAARADLAVLEHQIEQGVLRAPVQGVVRSRLLEPGDQASSQRPAYTLALTQPKWVRVYVSEPDLGRVRPGLKARVSTDSDPDHPITGQIGYISSVAEFTPKTVQTEDLRTSLVYEMRVIVQDPQNRLRLGQPVTVVVPDDQARR